MAAEGLENSSSRPDNNNGYDVSEQLFREPALSARTDCQRSCIEAHRLWPELELRDARPSFHRGIDFFIAIKNEALLAVVSFLDG